MASQTLRIQTPEVFTVREAAGRLTVCRTTLYELIRRGELAAVYIGADLRIPADAIVAYLADHLIAPRLPRALKRPIARAA